MAQASLATALVVPFEELRMTDVEVVGGKNASLGEMISQLAHAGVRVPGGFATTAHAFRTFLREGGLEQRINDTLARLDVDDVSALAETGAMVRRWVVEAPLPAALEAEVRAHYERLVAESPGASFAVRSSATAEDLPDASFAGQQETFLNVRGIDEVLLHMKEVFASLYNDRAISYRVHKGFAHHEVALSAGVQRMVRSDVGAAGVLFTIDTESGFPDVVFITASYGLGELVVQGSVNPDEFFVHKPTLAAGRFPVIRRVLGSKLQRMEFATEADRAAGSRLVKTLDTPPEQRNRYAITDADAVELARYAVIIEKHYGRPMDVEWAKDGITGKLYIVQARPETVKSRARATQIERFRLQQRGEVLAQGRAIAYRVHHGFKHEDVFLSAGVQLMVRSDVGASGVLFTLDTESGFRDVVFVTASYGLGETVVQGAVNPDEFYAYKPNLEAGRPAILRRTLGSKQIRMVYS
ncbi:MAG: PEP/pyruvate-binding domain-containing protein, partial [Betaproteobacteria bacterium]